MTRRELLFAVLITAAAVIKGARVFFDEVDRMTSWLVERTDGLDLGWDVPDTVPAWLEEGR